MDVKEFLDNLKNITDLNYYIKFNNHTYGKKDNRNYIEFCYLNDCIRVYDESKEAVALLNIIKDKLFEIDIIKTVLYEELDEKLIEYYLNDEKYINYSYYLYLINSNRKADVINKSIRTILNIQYSLVLDSNVLLILSNEEIGNALMDFTSTEIMVPVKIGFSQRHQNLYNLKLAYNEASIALDLVDVFSKERIYGFNQNKLDLIINGLKNARLNIDDWLYKLDDEDTATIQTFLDVNLNMAEASRNLYLHRNTLLYRLDKINKKTGLDIRNFDDALVMRIYLLLKYTKNRK